MLYINIFINKYFFQKVGFYSQKASIQRGVLSGVFNEIIRNIKLVYTKNAYDYEMNRFSRNNSLDKDITQKRDFFTNYSGPITEILSMVIMVFTIYMVTGNSTKIGESITYIYVIFRLMPYIKMINNNKVQLVSSLGAIDNILHYTNDTSKDMDDGNNKSIGKINKDTVELLKGLQQVGSNYDKEKKLEKSYPQIKLDRLMSKKYSNQVFIEAIEFKKENEPVDKKVLALVLDTEERAENIKSDYLGSKLINQLSFQDKKECLAATGIGCISIDAE